jgi:hypothetical protein
MKRLIGIDFLEIDGSGLEVTLDIEHVERGGVFETQTTIVCGIGNDSMVSAVESWLRVNSVTNVHFTDYADCY